MRSKRFFVLGVLILSGLLGLSWSFWFFPGKTQAAGFDKSKLIRFHVIANSDSESDQAMKRKIRDLIVQEMTPKFGQARNVEEARQVVRANLPRMEQIARAEVILEGKDYPVKAVLGRFYFPIKNYGDITLPAGKYEAARVLIGEAQGANWWCVLFPPVCFHDVNKVISNSTTPKEQLVINNVKDEQSDEKKDNIIKVDNKDEIKVHFKFIELMQKSPAKFLRQLGNELEGK